MNPSPRSPLVALFTGLLLPGLGQIYCGEVARGAVFLLSFALLLVERFGELPPQVLQLHRKFLDLESQLINKPIVSALFSVP